MNENEHGDDLVQTATDHLDVQAGDQLDVQAGDQLDAPTPDQADQPATGNLEPTPEGDGETTGDQETAPVFPDDLDAGDDDELEATAPNPYGRGYGATGKFDAEAAPQADDAGNIVQDADYAEGDDSSQVSQ